GSPLSSITTTTTAATRRSLSPARPRRQSSAKPWLSCQTGKRAGVGEGRSHERIPVLRVPGRRPPSQREGDERAAIVLDAGADHADELCQRLLLRQLQGQRGRV